MPQNVNTELNLLRPLQLSGSSGTAGQALTTQGSTNPPTWETYLTPAGTQAVSNKTFDTFREKEFTITDAAGFSLDPANGPFQTITLGANRTPVATAFLSGQSMKLKIDDGTARTITWTTAAVVWVSNTPGASGVAPTLGTTGFTHIELWKEGVRLYGALIGYTAT